jgi:preprotein translocase subunit SecD
MTSIKILFVVGISWARLTDCFSQQSNGFYFVIEDMRNCTNIIYTFDDKQRYCTTKEPILKDSEFEGISEIEYDLLRQSKFVKLQLSKKGFELLKKLTKQLPSKKLLLVVNNRVVGVFNGVNQVISRSIPISGPLDSQEIDWVYNQLRKPL